MKLLKLIFLVAFVYAIWVYGCSPFPEVTYSLRSYEHAISSFSSRLVRHFPEQCPESKSDPLFAYFPGMLQGGAFIQLRVKLPANELNSLIEEMEVTSKHRFQGGGFFTHFNADQKNNVPTAGYHTSRSDRKEYNFPKHFTLYVLHADDHGDGWNHGQTCGVAISTETSEAIYWAEDW
jgi:hypothetical protein